MRALLILSLAACGGPAKPGGTTAAPLPPLRAPACTGKVVESKLLVGAVDLGIEIQAEHADQAKAVTWPYGPRSILLTWSAPGHYGAYDGGAEIWEVDCDAPAQKKSFLAIEGANFGASAMTRDGKTLYFSGPTYVRALDVATKSVRVVSKPGKSGNCWVAPSPEEGYQLVDTILELDEDDDVLIVSRGGPCGFEGDYEGTTVYIEHPAAPRAERNARPTSSIAVDAGGAWYVAADAAAWVTIDGAKTWRKAVLPDGAAPEAILPDPKRPGHVVVQTAVTQSYGPPSGGSIYATRDGGASWPALPLPDDVIPPGEMSGAAGHLAVEVRSSTDHLWLWGRTTAEASKEEDPAMLTAAWETTDGGKVWKRIVAPARLPGTPASKEARTAKGVVVKVSGDGLIVVEPGAKPRRIYPH